MHQKVPAYIRYHNNTLRKDIDIADSFNEFFSGIATNYFGKPGKNTPQTEQFHLLQDFVQSKTAPGNSFNIPPVREDWVRKTLLSLDKNKATGMDSISSKMLKIAAPYITGIVTKICIHSIKCCTFPQSWKIARVSPLHKKDSVHELTNYQPISVLPILSKVLEKHISEAFYEFLTVNDLLSHKQSGFHKKHSFETALTEIIDQWLHSMHCGEFTGLLFVDFHKACDVVDHSILLKKSQNLSKWSECSWLVPIIPR